MPESKHRKNRNKNRRKQGQVNPYSQTRRNIKKNINWIVLSILLLVITIVVAAVFIQYQKSEKQSKQSSRIYVEGIGKKAEMHQTRKHFDSSKNINDIIPGGYKTIPPTSGDHWSFWAKCGFYPDGIDDEQIVHNLEHSNVVINYNIDNYEIVQKLYDIAINLPDNNSWLVTRYYDKLDHNEIAISVWGIFDKWNIEDSNYKIDKKRIELFYNTYVRKVGPEFPNGLPCSN